MDRGNRSGKIKVDPREISRRCGKAIRGFITTGIQLRPLLCSGPAVSPRAMRRGFFICRSITAGQWPPSGANPTVQQLAQPAAAIWKLDSSVARLTLERAQLAVNLLHPAAGLLDIEADRVSLALLHPLNVEILPASSEGLEAYVRGADLVATYAQRPEPAMRTQIYWRTRRMRTPRFSPSSCSSRHKPACSIVALD